MSMHMLVIYLVLVSSLPSKVVDTVPHSFVIETV